MRNRLLPQIPFEYVEGEMVLSVVEKKEESRFETPNTCSCYEPLSESESWYSFLKK